MGTRNSGMNLNPRELAKAMQRLGVQQQEIDAEEVIIRCKDKEIVISQPQVAKVNMMGQESWQITGKAIEREQELKEEDVKTVMEQANTSREQAINAIKKAKGDLARAIIEIQGTESQ